MSRALINKLVSVLDSVLKKLSRYDEGSFFAQILSLTVMKKKIECNLKDFYSINIFRNQLMKMDKHMYYVLMQI
jgi:hypothetical protein